MKTKNKFLQNTGNNSRILLSVMGKRFSLYQSRIPTVWDSYQRQRISDSICRYSIYAGWSDDRGGRFCTTEKGVETLDDAIAGASDIIAEMISDDAEIRKILRELYYVEKEQRCNRSSFEKMMESNESRLNYLNHLFNVIKRNELNEYMKLELYWGQSYISSLIELAKTLASCL